MANHVFLKSTRDTVPMFAPTYQTEAPTLKSLLSRLAITATTALLVFSMVATLNALDLLVDPDESLKLYAQAAHLFVSCAVAIILLSFAQTYSYHVKLPLPDLWPVLPAFVGSLIATSLLGVLDFDVDMTGLSLAMQELRNTKSDLLANTIATGLLLSALERLASRDARGERASKRTASLLAFLWAKHGAPRPRKLGRESV